VVDVRDVGPWSVSALVRAVAEGGVFCFAATAGPDRPVFFYGNHSGGFARPFVGAVAVGRVLGLATAAKGKGLASDGIDLVGRGLPAHEIIIEQALENESANCARWKVEVWRACPIDFSYTNRGGCAWGC
jgi:hypothetical protein